MTSIMRLSRRLNPLSSSFSKKDAGKEGVSLRKTPKLKKKSSGSSDDAPLTFKEMRRLKELRRSECTSDTTTETDASARSLDGKEEIALLDGAMPGFLQQTVASAPSEDSSIIPVPEAESACPSQWPEYVPLNDVRSHKVPMHKRMKEERMPSLGPGDIDMAQASAHKLLFKDTQGRTVRYGLRPSTKKTRSTYLELALEGEKARKVRSVAIVDAKEKFVILDGKDEIKVALGDIEVVTKGLILLCKISRVKLDCVDGSPALRKVLSDLDVNRPLKPVLSFGELSGEASAGQDDSSSSGNMRRVVSTNSLSNLRSPPARLSKSLPSSSSGGMRRVVSTTGVSQMERTAQQRRQQLCLPRAA